MSDNWWLMPDWIYDTAKGMFNYSAEKGAEAATAAGSSLLNLGKDNLEYLLPFAIASGVMALRGNSMTTSAIFGVAMAAAAGIGYNYLTGEYNKAAKDIEPQGPSANTQITEQQRLDAKLQALLNPAPG